MSESGDGCISAAISLEHHALPSVFTQLPMPLIYISLFSLECCFAASAASASIATVQRCIWQSDCRNRRSIIQPSICQSSAFADSLMDFCVDLNFSMSSIPLMPRCNENPKAMNLQQVEQINKKGTTYKLTFTIQSNIYSLHKIAVW